MVTQAGSAIRAKLAEIFAKILKRPVAPGENVVRAEEKAWDSLRHVELVFVAEDAFGVTFSPEDVEKLTSLEAFAELVEAMHGEAA